MAPSSSRPTGPSPALAIALIVIATVGWGLATALSKVALRQLSPIDLLAVEIGTGATALVLLATARRGRRWIEEPRLLLLGVLEPGIAFLLFDVGLDRTSGTHASILVATQTIFVAGLAAVLLRERLDVLVGAALVATVAGTVLLGWGHDRSGAMTSGDLLILAAAATGAGYTVFARRAAPGRDALDVTGLQMVGALLVVAPLILVSAAEGDSRLGSADASHVAVAVGVGFVGTVLPYLLFNAALSSITATRASLIVTLVPVFGAGASVAVLAERLGTLQLVGGGAVVSAAALVTIAGESDADADRG